MVSADLDIAAARRVHIATRYFPLSEDPGWDTVERFSLLTVAAGARRAALLMDLQPSDLSKLREVLMINEGFSTVVVREVCEGALPPPQNHTPEIVQAFLHTTATLRPREAVHPALWVFRDPADRGAVKQRQPDSPGELLGYPPCCVADRRRGLATIEQAFLDVLVKACGNDPAAIAKGLRDDVGVDVDDPTLEEYARRPSTSRRRYPFIVHHACLDCLDSGESPSAGLNEAYKSLALEIDQQLHDKLASFPAAEDET